MHPQALVALAVISLRLALGLAVMGVGACPDPPSEDADARETDAQLETDLPETTALIEVVEVETMVETEAGSDPDIEVTATECTPGVDSGCDDANPCTDDTCRPNGTCAQTPNIDLCDDDDTCTSFDRCTGGTCLGNAIDCSDGSECTTDSCVGGVCEHAPESGPCEDGDVCTEGDQCADGVCAGSPVVCPGGDSCTIAACEARVGCTLTVADDGVACEDGNACTTDTECVAGACRGALVGCGDDNPCTDDYCDPTSGCSHRDNKAACDDADRCTVDDRCDAGSCVGVAAGVCCADDLACDDGDGCTVDRCEGPSCEHVPLACDDDDVCTRDVCEADVCSHGAWAPLPEGGQVVDDFEGALDAWTFSSDNAMVGWRADASWVASGLASLYCGDAEAASYDHGKTLARAQRTILVPPGDPELHFEAKTEVDELGSCLYDVLSVLVDGDVVGLVCGSGEGTQTFSLAAYEGREVELALVFDTIDALDNAGRGVWIDRLRLTANACN